MPDIFDTLDAPPAAARGADVFDEVAGTQKRDVFDELTPAKTDVFDQLKPGPPNLSLPRGSIFGTAPEPDAPRLGGEGLQTPTELQTILRGPRVLPHAWEAVNRPLLPLSKLKPSAQTVQDAMQALASGSPELTQEESQAVLERQAPPDTLSKVIAGGESSALRAAEGMTSPFNIATLGAAALPKAIGRIVSGLFAADMASKAPEEVRRAKEAIAAGDPEQITEAIGDLVATGAFTGAAGLHALKPSPKESPTKPIGVPRGTIPEPPADTSATALQELEAALRGNQLKPKAQAAPEKVDFQPEPVRAEPTADAAGVEVARQPAPVLAEPQPPPVGAETITGPPSAAVEGAGNERTGSGIPAEREKRPTPTGRAPPERPPDIIDEILAQVGHVDPTLIRQANPDWKPVGAARALFRRGGVAADSAITGVTYETGAAFGVTADMPLDQFGDAINAAAMARRGQVAQASKERASLDAEAAEAFRVGKTRAQFEQKAIEGQRPKSGPQAAPVPVDGLVVGDRFKVQDVTFSVSGLETDPDGNLLSVTLKDGPKFGVQRVGGNTVIHVDEGTMRRNRKAREQATQFLPEEQPPAEQPAPLELAKPESVEEQRARTEAETQRATEAEQRRKVQEGAAKPLTGSVGDIGQGDLLGGGDLFSAAKPKPDAVEGFLDRLKIDTGPDQLHAFGLVPEVWNGLIETVRIAYRAGRTIHEAIQDGIDWLRRAHPQATFDEPAVRAHFQEELARRGADILPDTPAGLSHERLGEIATEAREMRERMRAMRTAGREVPQSMRDRMDELQSLVDEASHAAPRARGGIPATPGPEGAQPAQPRPGEGRPVPRFQGAERLPGGTIRDLFRSLRNYRQKLSDWWARGDLRKVITRDRDAAEARAKLLANEVAGHVRLTLNRALGVVGRAVRVKNDLREYALTFAIEADGDSGKLADFHAQISDSEHADTKAARRALAAISYAQEHWEQMQPTAAEYRRLNDVQREEELNAGINSNEWEGGYVYHRWKHSPAGGGVDPNAPSAAPTPFRRPRTVPDYATGIAEGGVPHTLNAVELTAARIADGQNKMTELSWLHGLREMADPVSGGEPLVVDVIRKPRRPLESRVPGGQETGFDAAAPAEWVSTAPPGYEVQRVGDVEFAIKRGMAGLITDLTSKSWFEAGGIRTFAKRGFGFSKSVLLLFDTFHLGRIALWQSSLTGRPRYGKGATLLDYTAADIREMAARGEIPEHWADELVENKRRLDLAVRTGYNVGTVLDNVASDWVHNIPGIGTFNKWLFGQFQRGAMAEAWLIEFERLKNAHPGQSENLIAEHLSRDLNARFGNLGRQGLIRTKTGQDIARLVFLAPQWNEALIRSELGAVGQALRAPVDSVRARRLVMGTLLKSTGTLALGTFLANQILNYAFRGKPTWENEEEGWPAKISAWIPDAIGNGPGFMLNPLALPAEYAHLIEGQISRSKDTADAAWRIANSRLASPSRALLMLATRKDALGRSLKPGEVLPALGGALIPVPLAGGALGAAAKEIVTGEPSEKYPGQFEKQALATFGVKVDQAPTQEQRVRKLAREFNAAKGIVPSGEFFAGDFDDLTRALRIGNQSDARDAMEELLGKKTRAQILEHFTRWVSAPYTGQRAREGEFMRGLSAEQRQAYLASRDRRRELARAAYELLRSMPQTSGAARR